MYTWNGRPGTAYLSRLPPITPCLVGLFTATIQPLHHRYLWLEWWPGFHCLSNFEFLCAPAPAA
jgi:hypothetical protein